MSKRKEMIGKKFGRLTVIKLDEERNRIFREERNKGLRSSSPVCYICECECGNICSVKGQKLRDGRTKSCGCIVKIYDFTNEKYVGKTYGGYTIIKYHSFNEESGKHYFLCKCICGTEKVVDAYNLIYGNSNNCGCAKSVNNQKICDVLKELNIPFEKEYYFNNDGHKSFFDVFIPTLNIAIEYDGEDHFIPIDRSGKGMEYANEQLKIIQHRDERKNIYCQQNNIQLVRIPYWKKNDIRDIIINLITLND